MLIQLNIPQYVVNELYANKGDVSIQTLAGHILKGYAKEEQAKRETEQESI